MIHSPAGRTLRCLDDLILVLRVQRALRDVFRLHDITLRCDFRMIRHVERHLVAAHLTAGIYHLDGIGGTRNAVSIGIPLDETKAFVRPEAALSIIKDFERSIRVRHRPAAHRRFGIRF